MPGRGRGRDPLRIPPNAATRAIDRWVEYALAGDWDALRALCAPIVHEDRRPLFRITGDCEMAVANSRLIWESGARPSITLLATAGDRLLLQRVLWTAGGDAEVENLEVVEVDVEGRVVAYVIFDPDDHGAASAEMLERYVRSGADGLPAAAIELVRAWNDHDLGRLRALLPGDYFFHDHRRTGIGRVEGADAYIASLAALYELSRDVRLDPLYLLAVAEHGFVSVNHFFGTNAEGGEFESVFVGLSLYRGERLVGFDLFEIDDLAAAQARFEELRPDPLRIPLNAAARAYDRWYETVKAGNWDAVDALYGASYVLDDRRRLFRETHRREGGVTNTRFLFEGGWQPVRTLLATAGDRLALQRIVWTTDKAGAASEIEVIELGELDGEGRFVRVVLFDPDDRAAASAELFERWIASSADAMPAALVEYLRAWNDHDLLRLRAATPGDFVVYDRRRTGIGRIDRDGNIASLAALWELSRDVRIEPLYEVATVPHGLLVVNRWFGTNAEGGDFETVYVALVHAEGERLAGLELFEIDDLETAKARFAELCVARTT